MPLYSSSTQLGQYLPSDHGLHSWTGDPSVGTINSSTTANGTLYLVALRLRTAATISTLWVTVGTAAVTATTGQNGLALYSSAGTLLSSAMSDTIFTTAGLRSGTLAAPQTVAPGFVWVGILGNAATPALLARSTSILSATSVGIGVSAYRFAINGTGLTAFPGSITPASNTQTGAFTFWAAAS